MNDIAPPLLRVCGLTKSFRHGGKELHVLRGIDLAIDRGEMVAIVGASGAGKSTLLHIIGTLDAPTTGHVEFDGQDVTRMNARALAAFRNRTIGFVFQFHHLLPEFNAVENAMMPAIIGTNSHAKPHVETPRSSTRNAGAAAM